jgi:hypothetical protein
VIFMFSAGLVLMVYWALQLYGPVSGGLALIAVGLQIAAAIIDWIARGDRVSVTARVIGGCLWLVSLLLVTTPGWWGGSVSSALAERLGCVLFTSSLGIHIAWKGSPGSRS